MKNPPPPAPTSRALDPHGLPPQRPSRSVKPLLVILGASLLANAAAELGVAGPLSGPVIASAVLGAGVLVLARITHSRVPGIGWGLGCLVAILAVAGGLGDVEALAAGARQLHVLIRAAVVLIGAGYLAVSVLALWFWISRRPPPPNPLSPIGWQ